MHIFCFEVTSHSVAHVGLKLQALWVFQLDWIQAHAPVILGLWSQMQ